VAHDQESILVGLVSKLTSVQTAGTFYEAVGGRIYRTIAPPDTEHPCCVISVVDDEPDRYFGAADTYMTVNISLIGLRDAGETALQGIAAKLFTLLETAALTITGHVGGQAWVENRGIPITEDHRIQLTTLWGIAATAA
jgi:hypothetical protein